MAAGQKNMRVRAVEPGRPDLRPALAALSPAQIRGELIRSMTDEAVSRAGRILVTLQDEHKAMGTYLEALEKLQNESIQRALSHFPTERVLGRFARIWLATDPTHIKIMRRTGRVIEWPIKTTAALVKHLRSPAGSRPPTGGDEHDGPQLDVDLLDAASFLYQQAAADHIQAGSRQIPAPAGVGPARETLRRKDWKTTLTYIQAQRETILSWSVQLERDLGDLADQLRGRMGIWDRMRQTFAAMLNVLPATAAITYVLSTGDPVGAAGIKIKLTGLLGLKDLYALIAIPATAGLKKADQKQLSQLLQPVARTWLEHKFAQVQALFEQQITGPMLQQARDTLARTRQLLDQAEQVLAGVKEASQ